MVEKKRSSEEGRQQGKWKKEKIGVNATEHEWKYKSSKNLHHEL
jgi:hypothetical protein